MPRLLRVSSFGRWIHLLADLHQAQASKCWASKEKGTVSQEKSTGNDPGSLKLQHRFEAEGNSGRVSYIRFHSRFQLQTGSLAESLRDESLEEKRRKYIHTYMEVGPNFCSQDEANPSRDQLYNLNHKIETSIVLNLGSYP